MTRAAVGQLAVEAKVAVMATEEGVVGVRVAAQGVAAVTKVVVEVEAVMAQGQ